MTLICEGILFIAGLVIIFTGKAKIGSKTITGSRARNAGLVLILPPLIALPIGVMVGLQYADRSQQELLEAIANLSVLEIGGVVVALVIFLWMVSNAPAEAQEPPSPFANVLTVREAAQYLRVSEQDVLNLIDTNQLAAARIGNEYRIAREAITQYLTHE